MRKKSKKQRLKDKAVNIATQKKLEKNPYCLFCGKPANTCHHFVKQSRSNYLRCDERNLIPICAVCHCRLHSGYESIMSLELERILGKKWADSLLKEKNKTIHDTIGYWENIILELQDDSKS